MNAVAMRTSAQPSGRTTFSLTMDAGHEEMWLAIRQMPRNGFTAERLARDSGATVTAAGFYLAKLERQGIAASAGITTTRELLYQVARLPVDPVVLDTHGQPSRDYLIRKVLWTAIRTMRTVTVKALWNFAREHVQVTREIVKSYIARLTSAGYLTQLDDPDREGETEFHLKPAMNSGRLPPRLCEAELIYDVNSRTFFGIGKAYEVKL